MSMKLSDVQKAGELTDELSRLRATRRHFEGADSPTSIIIERRKRSGTILVNRDAPNLTLYTSIEEPGLCELLLTIIDRQISAVLADLKGIGVEEDERAAD